MNNIFNNPPYMRKVALIFSLTMVPLWLLLGFDSGIAMIEEGLKALVNGGNVVEAAYSIYGRSFHFSSFVLYGLLYVALSKHYENLGLKDCKNVFYSAFLVILNMMIFEFWYMANFNHFQMQRSLVEWFITDLWFLLQYLGFLLLGVWTLFALRAEGFLHRFRFHKHIFAVLILLVMGVSLWIFYPLPVETVSWGDWTNSTLFPQTHYAYVNSQLYVPNDLLHLVNVGVKALVALTQWCILTAFRRKQP